MFKCDEPKNLGKFLSAHGKILPRRLTGLTPRSHGKMAKAIKRARHLLLLRVLD
jgi:small subunit ribosomal protein S18